MLLFARQGMLVFAVAVVCAGVGSALFASPALAGGVDTSDAFLNGALYNLTPYTWTKVAQGSPQTCYGKYADGTGGRPTSNCWDAQQPASTIAPGAATGYTVECNLCTYPVLGNLFSTEFGYNAWVTYQVDVLGGTPEYLTFTVSQCYCTGTYGSSYPALDVWNTTTPPPANYNPGANANAPPANQTANPQITYSHNVPDLDDQTFQIAGNYTVDASTDLGAPFVSVLNTICGSKPSACSFTQTSPLQWGVDPPVKEGQALNCTVPAQATRAPPAVGAVGDEPPPANDPNWFQVEYEAAQSATLSVGGGITASTEFNLFDTISGKISVKVEAEHEWQEVKTLTRSAKVFIPSNDIASIWVAPVVGKVTGTLVVSNGSATFTAINFTEERSGVTKGNLTPAFNVITNVRPMTPSEINANCQNSTQLGATQGLGKPPVKLLPERGVAKVSLGQTEAQVLGALGEPSVRRFLVAPCAGLAPGCDATAGRGGRWSYRKLVVVFGPDGRVSGLIYSGSRVSAKGVGVGSSLGSVRAAYPRASCTGRGKQRYCTLQGALAGRTAKTVFRLVRTRAGRYDCDRVLIYEMSAVSGEVRG